MLPPVPSDGTSDGVLHLWGAHVPRAGMIPFSFDARRANVRRLFNALFSARYVRFNL